MDTNNSQVATHLNQGHIHPNQEATLHRRVHTPQRPVATLQQPVAILLQPVATLLQGAATPNSQADTHLKLAVTHLRLAVTLPHRVVTPQQQGATLPRPVAVLPQLEASHLRQEDTKDSLEQEAIPPCLQEVEAGVQHQAAKECQEGLNRDTQGALLQASPCQVTQEPLRLTPPCLDMEVELRPILRHQLFLKGTGVL